VLRGAGVGGVAGADVADSGFAGEGVAADWVDAVDPVFGPRPNPINEAAVNLPVDGRLLSF